MNTSAIMILLMIAVCTMGASCDAQQKAANFFTEPIHIRCVGKGVTTIAAAGYSGTIQSDCGTGFEYYLERGTPTKP
jgi:hypothetical protein